MHRFESRSSIQLIFVLTAQLGVQSALACQTSAPCANSGGARSITLTSQALGVVDPDHDDAYLYRLPYGDAVSFPVLQGYGAKLSHRGAEEFTVDFGMPEGTLVHAAREGIVIGVEETHEQACWASGCGDFANFVAVLHADGTTGEYYHLARESVLVEVGDSVARGQVLARSGNTGYTTVPHLHFGVYRAAHGGSSQSISVRFTTRSGIVLEPRTGARYLNRGQTAE